MDQYHQLEFTGAMAMASTHATHAHCVLQEKYRTGEKGFPTLAYEATKIDHTGRIVLVDISRWTDAYDSLGPCGSSKIQGCLR